VVENAFGILAARFRVFRSPMEIQPVKAVKIVLAATVGLLHNVLRSRASSAAVASQSSSATSISDTLSDDGFAGTSSMLRCMPCHQKNPTLQAKVVRTAFARYFMNGGQVSWQWNL